MDKSLKEEKNQYYPCMEANYEKDGQDWQRD